MEDPFPAWCGNGGKQRGKRYADFLAGLLVAFLALEEPDDPFDFDPLEVEESDFESDFVSVLVSDLESDDVLSEAFEAALEAFRLSVL
jgi:hypothetical protein